jgi:hypothetical protein
MPYSGTTPKPMFNVASSFLGVNVITFNRVMNFRLQSFIHNHESFINDDEEVRYFFNALKASTIPGDITEDTLNRLSFAGSPEDEPSFMVERFFFSVPVQTIKVNESMRHLLADYIYDISLAVGKVDPIVWAFRNALNVPGGRPDKDVNVANGENYNYI